MSVRDRVAGRVYDLPGLDSWLDVVAFAGLSIAAAATAILLVSPAVAIAILASHAGLPGLPAAIVGIGLYTLVIIHIRL
jgi:hypothetical protein